MTNFPEWWFWLSGVFFVLNILLFIGFIVAIFMIVGVIKSMQPKIEALTVKVDGIATKVSELTDSTKAAVDDVGTRAKSVASSVEKIAQTASVQFEKFSPILIGGLTALRLMSAVREYRKGSAQAEADESGDEE